MPSPRPATTFRVAGWIVPRLIGLCYAAAFWSWGVQADALTGSDGILPAAGFLEAVQGHFRERGESAFVHFPTLFLWHHGDGFVRAVCWAGLAAAGLVMAGVAQGPLLAVLWFGYLSLVNTGGIFMGYQWDALLLEAGLLAVLASPWRWFTGRIPVDRPDPPLFAWLLLGWLLFRLMFFSGFVKLASDDETWRQATALTYHYETQPLPTWAGWWAHQLPRGVQVASCWVMFVIELALPFAMFFGRWGRLTAWTGFTGLMVLILLTGNYTFFNLLGLALALTLLDDSWWPARIKRWLARPDSPRQSPGRVARWVVGAAGVPLLVLSLIVAAESLGLDLQSRKDWLSRQARGFRAWAAPFHSVNSYGLFAVMTTERREIVIEVSADGTSWHELAFRWKPGEVSRRPGFVAPHQPRLDWQMWFAALGPPFHPQRDMTNPRMVWFGRLLECLLEQKQPVWDLFGTPPIPIAEVRHVRCRLYRVPLYRHGNATALGRLVGTRPRGRLLRHVLEALNRNGRCGLFAGGHRERTRTNANAGWWARVERCVWAREGQSMRMSVLRWLLLPGLVAQGASGGLTWTDRGASAIKRMNFNGTGLVTLPVSGAVNSPGTNIRGLALDPANGRMFWTDNGTDRVLTATLDGKNSAILAAWPTGTSFLADVRLGPNGQTVYFCDQQRNVIERFSYGAGLTTVIPADVGNQPYFLDLDFAAGKVYWSGFASGTIYRANLNGSDIETIITGNTIARGVCLDLAAGMVYWINRDARKVHRCALAALPVDVGTSPAVQTLYEGLDTPHGLALDLPAGKLYWADTGSNAGIGLGDKAVSRGDLDGSTPLEVIAAGSEPWDVDVDPRCSSYAEWQARYFRRDTPGVATTPSADPEGDRLPNLIEYATGHHPLRAEPPGPVIEQFIHDDTVTGFKHLAVRYRRRPAATDIAYYVQVSEDLIGWRDSRFDGLLPTTIELGAQPAADFMDVVTTRAEAPLDPAQPVFLRLRVEQVP